MSIWRSFPDSEQLLLFPSERKLPADHHNGGADKGELEPFTSDSTLQPLPIQIQSKSDEATAPRGQPTPAVDHRLLRHRFDPARPIATLAAIREHRVAALRRCAIRGTVARSMLLFSVGLLTGVWVTHAPERSASSALQPVPQPNRQRSSTRPASRSVTVLTETVVASPALPIPAATASPVARAPVQSEPEIVPAAHRADVEAAAHSRAELASFFVGGTTAVPALPEPNAPDAEQKAATREISAEGLTRTPTLPPVDALTRLAGPTAVTRDSIGPPRAAESRISDTDAVRQTLRQYKSAYEDLDIAAAVKVWPSVNRRELARAFATIRSQGLTFESCEIDVADRSATAFCRGVIQYVPKVGSPIPSMAHQVWLFRMHKFDADWKIETVTASRSSTPTAVRTSGASD